MTNSKIQPNLGNVQESFCLAFTPIAFNLKDTTLTRLPRIYKLMAKLLAAVGDKLANHLVSEQGPFL